MNDLHSFRYESSDVPLGMTLAEWRHARYVAPTGLWARFRAWCHR